jgi:hypothetical protein
MIGPQNELNTGSEFLNFAFGVLASALGGLNVPCRPRVLE